MSEEKVLECRRTDRRSYLKKLALGALSIGALLSLRDLPKASAAAVTTGTTNSSGQIAFWDGASDITGSNNLKWDDTNRKFVGTRALQYGLDETANDAGGDRTGLQSSTTSMHGALYVKNSGSTTIEPDRVPAIMGEATATSQYTCGVSGKANSPDGWGVFGWGAATSGYNLGVYGYSASTSGLGVAGEASATTGDTRGVYGLSKSTSGIGVSGRADATSGNTVGVRGISESPSGICVLGLAGNAGAHPIVAQGASGQTASLQEWQNNSGTALSVVDAAGKLGVGISAPDRQIHLQGNNAVFRMDRDANSSAFMLVRTAAGNFSTIWKTFYVGVNASGVNNGSFFIGDVGANVSGPSTVRLAIDNSGNVGVGTEIPGYLLDVAGQAHATSFPTSSDERFKDEVAPLENVLERLDQIRGVTFEWNNLYASLGRATEGRQIGLIAQEVEKNFPELVSRWRTEGIDDCRAVDYGRFTAVLLEAIKELHGKLQEKSEEIKRLQAKMAEIEQRLNN